MKLDRKKLEAKFGHLEIFDQVMEVIEGIESGRIKPRVIDYTGSFPELEQGELEIMWREEE